MPPRPTRCPVCSAAAPREADAPWPFCSARCKKLDWDRWLTGAYAIAGPPVDDDDPKKEAS